MYLCILNNYGTCNSHYNIVAVLGFENWVGRSGAEKNTYTHIFLFGKVED